MTEYDFSPEAYQHHLQNMHSISKWVDRTEQHRSEFVDAAALTEGRHKNRSGWHRRSGSFSVRRAPPPPLPLPPHCPNPAFGMQLNPYSSPPHSLGSFDAGFPYASGPTSPGPMPPHMYLGHPQPFPPPSFVSPPPSPHRPPHKRRSSRSGHSHSSSYRFLPPSPINYYSYTGMGGASGYGQGQGYFMPPPPPTHRNGHHRGGVPYITYG